MQVIVINGSGGCGKDTFVRQFASQNKGGIINASTIDPIKAIATQVGWDGTKDEKGRKFLSDLKDLLTEFNDLPLNYIRRAYEEFSDEGEYMFVHCREPKEIQKLANEFNAITLLITADERVPIIDSNHADNLVKEYNYDYVISNNGTLYELNEKVKEFLHSIKGE